MEAKIQLDTVLDKLKDYMDGLYDTAQGYPGLGSTNKELLIAYKKASDLYDDIRRASE